MTLTVNLTSMTTDPKGASGSAKPQLHLFPKIALESACGALALGRDKYGERNWANATPGSSTYIAAALRHIFAWQSGEDLDPESGVSHLGHAIAGLAIMLDAQTLGTIVDQRVRPFPDEKKDLGGLAQFAKQLEKPKEPSTWQEFFSGYDKGSTFIAMRNTSQKDFADQAVAAGAAEYVNHDSTGCHILFLKNV